MFCSKCGNQIPDDAKFCTKCGLVLSNENKNEASAPAQEPGQLPIKAEKKASKKYLILGAVAIAVVVVLVAVISNVTETKEMRAALENNDAGAIYNTYELAKGDENLIGKYEDLILDKIAEISDDINRYDCSETAQTEGASVFNEYLHITYGDLFDGEYHTLEDSVYGTNQAAYDELLELMASKANYYDGIYYSANAEDVYDYEEAIESFSAVRETDSNYEDAISKISECTQSYMELTLNNVEDCIANDDISGAISILNAAKSYFDSVGLDSSEIQAEIDSTIAEYAKRYADKAEAAFKEQDVNTAVGNIEVAIELQPENADYLSKKDEYELYLPYELYLEEHVLEFEENGDFWGSLGFDKTYTANDGSEMPHSIKWYNNSDDATVSESAIYNLQGKYDVVTGTIFLFEEDKSTDYEGYFVVYGDGKKIYTSPKVTSGVIPQDVSFEVSDVQTLEIAFFGQGEGGFLGGGPDFGVSNLVAQKDFP